MEREPERHQPEAVGDISSREAELGRLEALLQQAPDGIFIADIDGRYMDVNKAGCELLGYEKHEIVGRSITDLIPPDEVDRLWEQREGLLHGRVITSEWRLLRKDGTSVPVEVSAKILPDGRWQGFVRDISERLALEKSLRESNEELKRAQSIANVGSWHLNLEQGKLVWSDQTYRIFAIPSSHPLTYETFLSLVHPEDRAYVDESWQAALQGAPYDIEHRVIAGNQIKWVREKADIEFHDDGSIRRGLGVVLDITEEKHAGEARRIWQEQLEAIVSISPDAIISIDEDTRVQLFNPGAEKIFGWSRNEMLGRPLEYLFPRRIRDELLQQILSLSSGEGRSKNLARHGSVICARRKSGQEFPSEGAISKFNVAGKHMYTVTLRDVSDRIAKEQALRESEERLRVSLRASPVVVFNQDRDLRYTWIHNPKEPFTPEDFIGKTDFDLFREEDAETLTRIKRSVLQTGVRARSIVQTTIQDETFHYDLTVEPVHDHTGAVSGITCATWDVTEQEKSQKKQRILAEAGSVLLGVTFDFDQILQRIGELAVREIADWFLIDLIEPGQVRRLRISHSDKVDPALTKQLEKERLDRNRPHLMYEPLNFGRTQFIGRVTDKDLRAMAQNEGHLDRLRKLGIRSLIAVPLISRGKRLGAFAFVSCSENHAYHEDDVAFAEEVGRMAALAVENARLHKETQRLIDERDKVLGIVAHDLRNPLTAVLTQAELLELNAGDSEKRSLQTIKRAVNRMNRLVRDILDVTRIETGTLAIELQSVNSDKLLEEVFASYHETVNNQGHHLHLEREKPLPDIRADHHRLIQVFDNLIGNAIKFTPTPGEIVIGAAAQNGEVLFWVKDNGPGLTTQQLPHLFDRFWQAQHGDRRGAGLGLPIVKGIIESHGGQVQVRTGKGEGMTFCFTIPSA